MDAFWEFVNKRSVRFVLAAFCILLAIQGVYGIVIARNGWDLFRGAERLCFGVPGHWSIFYGLTAGSCQS